jgi:hypothetical protein
LQLSRAGGGAETEAAAAAEEEEDEDENEDEDEDDEEFLESLEDEDDDVRPGVSAGGAPWAQQALDVAERVVRGAPDLDLELFAFRATPANKRLDIRLDKITGDGGCFALPCSVPCCPPAARPYRRSAPRRAAPWPPAHRRAFLARSADRYGSPSLEEIGDFSRSFNAALEEALGAEAAGEIEVEVSSPVRR